MEVYRSSLLENLIEGPFPQLQPLCRARVLCRAPSLLPLRTPFHTRWTARRRVQAPQVARPLPPRISASPTVCVCVSLRKDTIWFCGKLLLEYSDRLEDVSIFFSFYRKSDTKRRKKNPIQKRFPPRFVLNSRELSFNYNSRKTLE
jgi:hypothetical protein